MRIFRGTAGAAGPPPGPTFTGEVRATPLLRTPDTAITLVTFVAGARTFWHTHEHGQLLYVTSGSAWVAEDDGTRHRLEPGDMAWTEPGARHWHGAVPGTDMTHVAVSLGRTTWLDEVPPESSGPG